MLKELSAVTEEDKKIELRQKAGQLRFGDVIALTYIEDIHTQALKLKYEEEAANSIIDNNAANQAQSQSDLNKSAKVSRLLGKPDYTYRGMVFSDGIIDSNMKVVPLQTEESQNATNMFRQCLFMVEIEQECAVNKKATKLLRQKADIEARRSKEEMKKSAST